MATERPAPRMCSVHVGQAVAVTGASSRRALCVAGLSLWPSSYVPWISGGPCLPLVQSQTTFPALASWEMTTFQT